MLIFDLRSKLILFEVLTRFKLPSESKEFVCETTSDFKILKSQSVRDPLSILLTILDLYLGLIELGI